MSERSSCARFWAAFNRLAYGGCDREEVKRDLVSQFSLGRTDSLKELTDAEYAHLCEGVERLAQERAKADPRHQELKRHRSIALHQLQLYGVDTTSWDRVNAFCLDKRIAGKKFSELSIEELDALAVKMRVIRKKKASELGCPLNSKNNKL